MKAIVMVQPGDFSVLKPQIVEDPRIGQKEVMVKLEYAAINHFDLTIRSGFVSVPNGYPHILGGDGTGTIIEVDAELSKNLVGERVLITGGGIGYNQPGTYAEKIVVSRSKIIPIPSEVSMKDAAASGLAYRTAWYALKTVGNVTQKDKVFIQGGSSNVGIAAVQLLKQWGIWVATNAGSSEKRDQLRTMGADEVFNYHSKSYKEDLITKLHDTEISLVLELIGGSTLQHSMDILSPKGRILLLGYLGGDTLKVSAAETIKKSLTLIGVNTRFTDKDAVREILELIKKGGLNPQIGKVFSLDDASTAHRMIEERKIFGKALLKMENIK